MKLILFQRDVGLVNRLMPLTTTVVCVIASVIPARLPAFTAVTPAFVLMAVYHWTLYRPDLLPFVAVFAAGLLLDMLSGAPLGMSSLLLLLAYALVLSQRQLLLGRRFAVVWLGFLGLTAAATVFQWLVVSVFFVMLVDVRAFLFQGVLTVATYPVVSYLLVRAQRTLLLRA